MFRTRRQDGLGSLFPPGVLCAHDRGTSETLYPLVAFWLKPVSIFGLLTITTFNESSLMLAMPSTLAPIRLMLAGTASPHGCVPVLHRRIHCSEGFRRFVTLPPYPVGYC